MCQLARRITSPTRAMKSAETSMTPDRFAMALTISMLLLERRGRRSNSCRFEIRARESGATNGRMEASRFRRVIWRWSVSRRAGPIKDGDGFAMIDDTGRVVQRIVVESVSASAVPIPPPADACAWSAAAPFPSTGLQCYVRQLRGSAAVIGGQIAIRPSGGESSRATVILKFPSGVVVVEDIGYEGFSRRVLLPGVESRRGAPVAAEALPGSADEERVLGIVEQRCRSRWCIHRARCGVLARDCLSIAISRQQSHATCRTVSTCLSHLLITVPTGDSLIRRLTRLRLRWGDHPVVRHTASPFGLA